MTRLLETLQRRAIFIALPLLAAIACSKSSPSTPPPPPVSTTFTLHYHRALSDYAGWTLAATAGTAATTVPAGTPDSFGATYAVTLTSGATALGFSLVSGSTTDAAGALSVDVSGAVREAWVFSGYAKAIAHKPVAIPANANQVAVYYKRADTSYSGWGLHLWGDVLNPTVWVGAQQPVAIDPDLGAGFVVDMKPMGTRINVIVHSGDTKDPGPDMGWDRPVQGDIVFITSGSSDITTVPKAVGGLAIDKASAHLLAHDTVAWNFADAALASVELRYSTTAAIAATDTDITGGTVIPLTKVAGGLAAPLLAKVPYLTGYDAYSISSADQAHLGDALKGQLVVVGRDASGKALKATQAQTAVVLDELYDYEGPLGVTFAAVAGAPTFNLWAPTAQSVKLHVYDASKAEIAGSPVSMTAGAKGLWTASGPASWYGGYYLFELQVYHPLTSHLETVHVTDPYAVSLSTNGALAQILDLADPALAPPGWDALVKPPLAAAEDIVLYESHIRDFSVTDATVAAERRGKYLAFVTDSGGVQSNGLKHLAALSAAGVTHLHLLPVFDLATVDEDPAKRVDIDQGFDRLCTLNPALDRALCTQYGTQKIGDVLAGLSGDTGTQAQIATAMSGYDSFNWGYDPFHYGAPEGSYASTAEGSAKIVEFRKMVQGLNAVGLRLVMDVVYNHTNASGLGDKSVLDKIVPGYYHRLDAVSGFVLNDTCCSDTATEHRMMQRLMVDTTVRWARDYKVSGFRFDLMSFHLKQNMLDVKAALEAIDPTVYLYGEGWDYGAVKFDARGVHASQYNMAGTGIGTFNDRIRDAGRGGGAFDSGLQVRGNPGFSSGLYLDPNESSTATAADKDKLAHALDLIKIGMAGNLADFKLVLSDDTVVTGGGVPYNGARGGYTQAPRESINYVSAHDNQILWDTVNAKLPAGRSMADRVKAHVLAMDVVLLGEGIPFMVMGDDVLRSKSLDGNSYDSGDWFNRIDWTLQGNGWKSGWPVDPATGTPNQTLAHILFADSSIAPAAGDIAAATAHVQEMLRVRKSTRLLRLATKADVMARVDFPNAGSAQIPGLIAMTVTDGACGGADLDPARDALVVLINPDKVSHTLAIPGATAGFTLHTALAGDASLSGATFASGSFTVPARSTAVFEQLQGAARGAGLPCNTH